MILQTSSNKILLIEIIIDIFKQFTKEKKYFKKMTRT